MSYFGKQPGVARFSHGDDATFETLTVNVVNYGAWVDQRDIDPGKRTLIIRNGSTSCNWAVIVYASRDGTDANRYLFAYTAAAAYTSDFGTQLLPEILGYASYLQVAIIPTAGQTGTQLNFQTYIDGKG